MNIENKPWRELIGDDIYEEFLLNPGVEKIGWMALAVVVEYLERKFCFLTSSFLWRFNIESKRMEIFRLLETKMPGKLECFRRERERER